MGGREGAGRSGRTPPALCLLLLWVRRGGWEKRGERVAGEGGGARERGTESIVAGLYVAVPNSS
jgi:hypothetical protein